MIDYKRQMARSSIILIVLLMMVLSGSVHAQDWDIPQSRDTTGTISGTIFVIDGGKIDGTVELLINDAYIAEFWNLDESGEFYFEGIAPGTYQLLFFDFGEILMGETKGVRVEAGRNTDVTITVYFTLSGMVCQDILEMGIEGYFEFVDDLLLESGDAYGWLSERGEDRVAQIYGDCKADENDLLVENFPDDEQDRFFELREVLEDFEWGYYSVMFFMGTGATHFGIRTQSWREEFLGDVIAGNGKQSEVSIEELDEALDILNNLESAISTSEGEYWDEDFEDLYRDTVNEFLAAAERVRELALTLRDPITVMVADYVGDYLE